MARCDAHGFEEAVDTCRDCRRAICASCVVRVRHFVLCTHCALVRAGVRRRSEVFV
jgi:hypothetical protein